MTTPGRISQNLHKGLPTDSCTATECKRLFHRLPLHFCVPPGNMDRVSSLQHDTSRDTWTIFLPPNTELVCLSTYSQCKYFPVKTQAASLEEQVSRGRNEIKQLSTFIQYHAHLMARMAGNSLQIPADKLDAATHAEKGCSNISLRSNLTIQPRTKPTKDALIFLPVEILEIILGHVCRCAREESRSSQADTFFPDQRQANPGKVRTGL